MDLADLIVEREEEGYFAYHRSAPPSEAIHRYELGLVPVPRMESYRGLIFVSFDPEVEELVDYLAGARPYIDAMMDAAEVAAAFAANGDGSSGGGWSGPLQVLRGTHRYGVKANWK